MKGGHVLADLMLLTTAVIWGGGFVAQRLGMEHLGPYGFNAVRFAMGAAALLPVIALQAKRSGHRSLFGDATLGSHLLGGIIAGTALFIAAALQQVGITQTTAGKAGFITGLYVVITPAIGLLLRYRPSLDDGLGAVMAAAGLYLLSVKEGFRLGEGDACVFAGAFFWAAHVLALAKLSPRMNPLVLACVQFAVCSLLHWPPTLLLEDLAMQGVQDAWGALVFGGFFSVDVAYTLQVVAQRKADPTHACIILSLESLFAVIFGGLLLGEVLNARESAGCRLMLAGVLTAQLRPLSRVRR